MANDNKKTVIRNSTSEFLTFSYQTGGDGIEVRVEDGTVWLTQQQIAELFDTARSNITEHIKHIFIDGELPENSTCRNFRQVRTEGNRQVSRDIPYYNLDMIISVGYRVNSKRATMFRQWAIQVLSDFALHGYVLDKKRMENGTFLGEDYFERLLEEIREIRLSERRFYQKITDIYATAMDYDKDSPISREFFAKVQNKLHYAVTGKTAPELIYERADANKANMGLNFWESSPDGKILTRDVTVAKNYLSEKELASLGKLVNAYLDLAERRAENRQPMTMEDWAKHLDLILLADGNELLTNAGKIARALADEKAKTEYKKFRVLQDKSFESDFDKEIKKLELNKKDTD